MSHIVQIQTEVRDPLAIADACRRLGLPEPVQGTAKLFSGPETGLLVRLEGWLYPLVIDTENGRLRYDNYGGQWGAEEHLNRFLQIYAVAKATREARQRGHAVREQTQPDGSILLSITMGG